jgi:hypothetical protein
MLSSVVKYAGVMRNAKDNQIQGITKNDVVGKCLRGFKMRLKSTICVILDPQKRVSLSRLWNLPTTSMFVSWRVKQIDLD